MKKITLHLLSSLGLLILCFHAKSQTKTFDYLASSLSTTACNVFNPAVTINGHSHSSHAGGVSFNSTYGLGLSILPQSSPPKSTAFVINYNFIPGNKYDIAITALGNNATLLKTSVVPNFNQFNTNSTTACTADNYAYSYSTAGVGQFSQATTTTSAVYNVPQFTMTGSTVYPYLIIWATGGLSNLTLDVLNISKIVITQTAVSAPATISSSPTSVSCGFSTPVTFTINPGSTTNISGYTWTLPANNNWIHNGAPAPTTITTAAGVNYITLTNNNNVLPSSVTGTILVGGSPSGSPLTSSVTFNACPSLSPTSFNITCNQASTQTFTISNPGNIPGVTGTSWTLGPQPNGWMNGASPASSAITTTGNTLTLTSVPGTVTSNVTAQQIAGTATSSFGLTATVNYNNCPCLSIGVPTGVYGVPGSNPYPGYYLNFGTVSNATSYVMEWFDVTTNSTQTTGYTISPGSFYYYFTQGHVYKFRVAALIGNCMGGWSAWSSNLGTAPVASCANGPVPSTLNVAVGCGMGSPGCPYTNFNWPAITGASQYQLEYIIFNVGAGITRPTVTVNASQNTSSPGITPVSGAGWTIKYRVRANCSGTWGSFSGWSSNFAIY